MDLLDNRFTRPIRKTYDRIAVSSHNALANYNAIANGPSDRRRALLCARSARNLYGSNARFAWDRWPVRDEHVRYSLPLRNDHAGFDWARALTALGHDIEVKQVYRYLVQADVGDKTFVDIGANFGQHSQYFLAAGWEVLSFEPNPTCKRYHELICQMNGWRHNQWHEMALSDSQGEALLSFPEGQEWLGTISKTDVLQPHLRGLSVPLRRLSSIIDSIEGTVIKIDVEGHERLVLSGCPPGLEAVTCLIFEANTQWELHTLTTFLASRGLEIFVLRNGASQLLSTASEVNSTNFAAVPRHSAVKTWLESRG